MPPTDLAGQEVITQERQECHAIAVLLVLPLQAVAWRAMAAQFGHHVLALRIRSEVAKPPELCAVGIGLGLMRGEQGSAQSIWMHPQTGTAFGVPDMRSPDAKASKGGS